MRKLFIRSSVLLGLLLLFSRAGWGQVNLIFNATLNGRDMRGLSFVQIMNTTPREYEGYLQVEVKNLSGSGTFVRFTVNGLRVRPGNNRLPAGSLGAAAITYAASEEGNFVRQTGFMPEGELEYCYRLVLVVKNSPDEIYENCFSTTNILNTPLQLISPEQGDIFCNKRPRFTWQPPMPLLQGTTFCLKLVCVEEGQTPAEAMLTNTPIIYQAGIRGFILPYPSGVPDLVAEKQYAWQVTAFVAGRPSLSEIWKFSIQCEKLPKDQKSYRELKASDDGGFLSTGSSLRFAVFNPYSAGPLKYTITDLGDRTKVFKGLPDIHLLQGINNVEIDLNKIPGTYENTEYLLTVVLPDGKKVSLRFNYLDDEN